MVISANKDNLPTLFLVQMPCISFSCLIALDRTPSTKTSTRTDGTRNRGVGRLFEVAKVISG